MGINEKDILKTVVIDVPNLKTQIDTWNNFKANGGEIEGDIKTRYQYTQGLIGDIDGNKMFIQATEFFSNNPKECSLGTKNNPFKDLFVGDIEQGTGTGRITMPNGTMFQWVDIEVSLNNSQEINATVTYPLSIIGDIYGVAWCNVRWNNTDSKFITANITPINRSTGTVRVYSAKPLTATNIGIRVYLIGTTK